MPTRYTIIFFVALIFALQCRTVDWASKENGIKISEKKLVQQISSNYPPYHSLSMSFQFSGLMKTEKFYYIGNLEIEANKKVYLILKEPILHSPLVTLLWTPQEIIFKDQLKNKETTIQFKNKANINLLGQNMHPQILFALIQGLCASVMEQKNLTFSRDKQSFKIETLNSSFILAFGEFGELKQLLMKETKRKKITVVDIASHFWYDKKTGEIKKLLDQKKISDLGSFYKKISLYNNYSDNYFTIKGTKFKIKLH